MITAIVRPEHLDEVAQAVTDAGARGMTVTEVRGFGRQYGHQAEAHPYAREILILPKLRVDILVSDEEAATVSDAIAKSVRTGAIGDGKIWICPVDAAMRVRTGELDRDAL